MTSFLEKTFGFLPHQPATICAVLGTSSPIMNCSAVPVTLSTDDTWDSIRLNWLESERKLLQLFSTFSDTMQFTEKLRIQYYDAYFVMGILENLIKNKRYFARTIRVLQLSSADALIEAFSRSQSTTTTPIVLSNLRSLSINDLGDLQDEQLIPICSHCPFLETLSIPKQYDLTDEGVEFLSNLKHLKTLDLAFSFKITDSGLKHLAKVSSLQSLNLACCNKISDSGLEHLAKLSSLQTVDLQHCDKITDSGLEYLAKLSSLLSLDLSSCKWITEEGCRVFAASTNVTR